MRILFLNHNYRYNSTYNRGMPMAEHLAQRGHTVTLLTVSRDHRWKSTWSTVNGVKLGEMPNLGQNNSGEGYGPLDNLLRVLHATMHRYDIIHMLDHKPNASFAGFPGRWGGAKLVADWADWWGGPGGLNDIPKRRIPAVGRFEEWWELKQKRWADGVTVISTVLRQRALDTGCPEERTIFIPTGAPVERIHPLPLKQAREKFNIALEKPVLGFIGIGQGDLDIVMAALQQLPDVWLMIVGPKNERVLEMAQTYGIADRLWQTGMIVGAQIEEYLACANVMCMPMNDTAANRGRLPNKLLEYLAAGRPVVASPIGDVKMIVEKYQVGLLAKDTTEFSTAIMTLLTNDALSDELGHNARKVAETVFNWTQLIDQLETYYHKILVDIK